MSNTQLLRSAFLKVTALIILAMPIICVTQASGQNSSQSARESALALTAQLLQTLQHVPPGSVAFEQLQQLAAERQQAMLSKMEDDPATVIAAALPDDVRSQFPAAMQGLIEQHVSVRGTIDVQIEDGRDYSRVHYGLTVAGRRLALHFADTPPTNLFTGMLVQLEGVQVADQLALTSSNTTTSSATSGSGSSLPNTFGQQNTLVMLVNFQDEAIQPVAPADVSSVLFGTSYSVSGYYMENSFQQTWLTGDVAGWYTIPVSYTTCDISSIGTYAQQAASAAGYVLSNYRRLVYIFPNNACSWWGTSTVGGNPSQSWIRDYNNASSGVAVMNLAHELGHGLGLYHSHGWNCSAYPSTGCSSNEYGDTLDFMGNSSYVTGGDFNAFQRERLGWLNSGAQPPITTVTSSGSYTLSAYEAQDGNPKALKIPQTNGAYYYVELRQALGYDSFLSGDSNVLNGVVIHLATPSNSSSSELLNMTSPSAESLQPALTVGQSYTDSGAGVTITPVSVSSSGASVQVTLAGATCTHASPSVSMNNLSTSVPPGATASFNVSVTNRDSSACSASTFNLASTVPSGWSASYNAGTVSLMPGTSTTVTLSVFAAVGTPNGTYTINSSAQNSSATACIGSASTSETIFNAPPVSVAVNTNSPAYTGNQSVSIAVTLLSGSSPAPGVSFAVTITKPTGATVALSGTTGSNGVGVVNYRVKKQDPKGKWQILATSGSSSATTSFTVQ